MTCREKLMIEHPENVKPSHFGGCKGCPSSYGYLKIWHEYCGDMRVPVYEKCTKCWDQEIPETEKAIQPLVEGLAKCTKTAHELAQACKKVAKTQEISDANQYQKDALRTESSLSGDMRIWQRVNNYRNVRLLQGLMGLNGEAGEALDILKKHIFQGHELEEEHLAKELGDVAWYLAVAADALGYDLKSIFDMNIEKLKERYPEGFDFEHSINRKENDI